MKSYEQVNTTSAFVVGACDPNELSATPHARFYATHVKHEQRYYFEDVHALTAWLNNRLAGKNDAIQLPTERKLGYTEIADRISDIVTCINLYLSLIEHTPQTDHAHYFEQVRTCTEKLIALSDECASM